MTEDSIEHLVTQRLDSLFGEDDDEGDAPSPQASSPKDDSALGPLRQAAQALKRGIDTAGVSRLNTEVRKIQQARATDPLYRPLLKMIGILADYLRTAVQNAHEETVPTVCSIVECMRRLEPESGASDLEKKRRIQKEIESFKAFRAKIQAAKRLETAPGEAAEAEPPPPRPERPPAPPQAPPPPEPVVTTPHEEKTPPAAVEQPPDLSWIQEEFSSLDNRVEGMRKILESHAASLNTRVEGMEKILERHASSLSGMADGMQKALEGHASSNAELRKALAQIANRLNVLAGLPESVKKLYSAVATLGERGAAERASDREEIQRFVREAVGELNDGLSEVRQLPAGVQELRGTMEESFNRLEERFKYLRGELHTIRADIAELRTEVEGQEGPPGAGRRPEAREGDVPEAEAAVPEEGPGEPEPDEAENGARPEEAREEEPEAPPAEPPPSECAADSDALTYFLFRVGEKKYAVEQKYVVKTSKTSSGLRKKALDRGGLTLSESTPGLFASKKGLEPAWSDMSGSEWKRTVFRLVPEEALEGLDQTTAGGVLFLGAGEDRLVLFTDQAAEGIPLSEEDEIQMAGSTGSSGPTCGSILRSGDSSEFYLILAPERLS